ncbi:hypothetical protein ACOI1C_20320 [Bacillus sp. DJP31]|uniref:hypothetical protein n=1 Tax=Bacillus sp. DJP31 TaxID=3409789 RepID=UPI003BB76662
MHEMCLVFAPFYKHKGKSIESLYDLLCSMVEKAASEEMEQTEKELLLTDIDELHEHIEELLGMKQYALQMLMANYTEVYEKVLEVGEIRKLNLAKSVEVWKQRNSHLFPK